jgi:hypothetical protein
MDKFEQERIRATEAQQLLDNKMFKEVFTALRADLFQKFQSTKWNEVKAMLEVKRTLKNLNNIEAYLGRIVTTGKMNHKA